MIQIASENLLIIADDGSTVSFDEDNWRAGLRAAFHRQGIHEDWMAEHLVLCLEEKIRLVNAENGQPPRQDELVKLLMNMLTASGYGEVGREFLKCQEKDLPLPAGDFISWSVEQAAEYLQRNLPLAAGEGEKLAEACLQGLERCGLPGCSGAFLQEMAVLLLHSTKLPEMKKTAEKPEPEREEQLHWQTEYIAPDFWREHFQNRSDFSEMLSRNILRAMPLSDIFPVVRLEMNLDKLASYRGGWQSELSLLPSLPEVLLTAGLMLAEMKKEVGKKWPLYGNPGRHLILTGFQKFPGTDDSFPERVRETVQQVLEAGNFPEAEGLQISYR